MRCIFRDGKLQEEFGRMGYLHLPLLNTEEVDDLYSFYLQQDLKPEGAYGFHISLDHVDREKAANIEAKITSVLWPRAKDLFDKAKVFTASYVVKEPGLENIVPPHQDWTFVDETKYCSFTLWVALHDVNMDNGALCILPGSTDFFKFHRSSPSPQARSPLTDYYFEIFPYMKLIEMKAGDVLIFDNRLIHASPPNTSESPRIAAGIGVTYQEAQLLHYYQIPESDPVSLECFGVDQQFFTTYNNIILSDLYEKGGRPEGYPSLGSHRRQVPELTSETLNKLITDVQGNVRNEALIKQLAAIYNYNMDGTRQVQQERSDDFESGRRSNGHVDKRTFWQKYTVKNIVAEFQYRLRKRLR